MTLKSTRLTDFNDPKTKGQNGEAGHFEVLGCEWQTDNRDGEKSRQEQVYQCQFKTWQNDPDNIHDDGNSTTGWLRFANFMTERCHAQYGYLEALDPERDANNSDT